MDSIVLLSCVVAAFFLSWLLFFVRSARLERKFDEMDRLLRLSLKSKERERPGAEPDVDRLQEVVGGLESRLERTVEFLESLRETQAESNSQKIHDMVERKLYNMGYDSVRLAAESSDYSPDQPYRISLEVARRGVSYKGFALVEDGVVVDSRLSPTYSMFP